ncbi:SCO1860 family LAETG-anchored protein [Streptomyces taklimakanensis]|uniref:SCO1860 family LAETG-anchored protein n=1 Tax=Streptomyces taklimakanensis TaxID=2569853 RepID=UPI00308407C5
MNTSVLGLLAAATLVGVAAAPAHAAGDEGAANAAVLRAGLEVSLLKGGVTTPLNAELNAVRAPGDAKKTALTVTLDGAHGDEPIRMLRADVAEAKATVTAGRTEGRSRLVKAEVRVPGLLGPLLGADLVTSRAVCEAGAEPVAESKIPGTVTVLGKKVAVEAGGTTTVRVAGVGTVELRLAETTVASDTAAATALALDIALDPADLGVAEVEGRVSLVEASCRTPGEGGGTGGGSSDGGATEGGATSGGSTGGGSSDGGATEGGAASGGSTGGGSSDGGATEGGATSGGATEGAATGGTTSGGSPGGDTDSAGTSGGANEPEPQTGSDDSSDTEPTGNLAETGGSSATPYIAGGALALVAAGGALTLARRRRAAGATDA